jgi:4-hydroxy-tetrahydrodipicolinate synthase
MLIPDGVLTVLVTPMTQQGDVDCEGLKTNARWLVEQGVHGLIPLGSTGEFASLTEAQKRTVLDTVVEAVGDTVPIVAGASAETTEGAIHNVRQARRSGASGALVLPPWYYTPDRKELIHHYTRISEAGGLPVMIYNNPYTSKVDIPPDVIAQLAQQEHIVAVKESSGNIRRIAEIRLLTEDRIRVFCGWEDMAYESLVMGARGWVCVAGNVIPSECGRLYALIVEENDHTAAWKVYAAMLPLLRYLEYEGKTQKALKYMLDKMGLCGGFSSSPKLPLAPEDELKIDRLMHDLGIHVTG